MADRLNQDLAAFRSGCMDAPEGTYIPEKQAYAVIGAAMDDLIVKLRELGFPVCNSDGAHNVEAVIFDWVRQTGRGEIESLIGLGNLDGDAHERAIRRLASDRDFLSMRSL
jgi:hypothetical protein